MIITSVKIENFKSIDKIEIPFDKVGDSYTKIFVGINESGKSNILEALSFFDTPKQNVSYDQYCNQKLEDGKNCNLKFYMEFEEGEREALVKTIKSIVKTELDLKIEIQPKLYKVLYLSSSGTQFHSYYVYDFKLQNQNLFIKVPKYRGDVISIVDSNNKSDDYEELNEDNFRKYFGDIITDFIKRNEPSVSIWKPTNKDLLYNVNLIEYKNNITANKPLYNIFKLSGYKDEKAISNIIDKVSIPKNRSKLKDKLADSLNTYIAKVWENQIDFVIDITETGNFTLFIKDKGKENIYDRFSITDRSQGAQHFLSLILSLSLSANNHQKRNELIIIDEPETHLHPSGIRNLAQELLRIGRENYMFIATHSPFMIDKNHKERHCIVKKNSKAITELNWIKDSDNIIDDEVLRDAFGIDVYRDLLNPHSVLVEGASDKLLLKKAFACLNHSNIGITNGHGSNIITLASKLNYDDLKVVVVLDDDEDGRRDKEKILQIGGLYTNDNVFTIRELISEVVEKGTIEDSLDPTFVKVQFEKLYKSKFKKDIDFEVQATRPILIQIIELLNREGVYSEWDMDAFKKQLSEEFKPNKSSLSSKNGLLEKLANSIVEKLK
jgi:predicted ATP-dependent endonuclease of OLD family